MRNNEKKGALMNVVIIGLGSMGRRRLRILKQNDQVGITVAVEDNKKRRNQISEEYHIKCYEKVDDIQECIDCAFVCTPPITHADLIKRCLEKDWHVFTEISLVNDEYRENLELSKKKNKVFFLSSTFLYREEIRYIKKMVENNDNLLVYNYHVGQYLPDWHPWESIKDFFVANRKTNGCREILAIELPWIQRVFGKIKEIDVVKRKISNLEINYDDTYLLRIVHENGNIGNVIVDLVSRQATRLLELFNENIYIRWEGTPDTLKFKNIVSGEMEQFVLGTYIHETGYANYINEYAYIKEVEEFFKVIEGKKECSYGIIEDLETIKWIDKIESEEE